MNLSVYLYELLKTNDCVIIPDLGGFIANYRSSGYDEKADQFSPPSKEVIFSGKLIKNDGLLVNFISEREGIGYLEARRVISEFVALSLNKLENGEPLTLDGVGVLHYDQNENLIFEPEQVGTLRTDVFGLDAFHFPPLVNKYNQPPKPVFRDKDPEPGRHPRPALKYLLIGVPILALLYFVPYGKILNQRQLAKQQAPNAASLSISDSPASLKPETNANLPGTKTEPITAQELKSATSSVAPEVLPVAESKIPPTTESKVVPVPDSKPEKPVAQTNVNRVSKGNFHVVGGCFKVRENADKLAQKLIKQGYPAEISNLGKSFFRVSVESFQTRKEAEQALAKLLAAEPETGYWLMADKK